MIAVILALAIGCAPNVFVVILDDVGNDRLQVYDEHLIADADMPVTPNIDALAAAGMRFTRFYTGPTCSPTRAQLLSGLFPAHTGVGKTWTEGSGVFAYDYETVGDWFGAAGYSTTYVGKWHLGPTDPLYTDPTQPNNMGWDDFYGSAGAGNCDDYFAWERLINGSTAAVPYYKPLDFLSAAMLAWAYKPGPKIQVHGLQVAHRPLHDPPAYAVSHPTGTGDPFTQYVTMIEMADYIVGALYSMMGPEDYFVLVSDNGTIKPTATFSDWSEAKGTMKEPGINCAMIVVGPGIAPGSTSDALVAAYDVAPTLCDLASVPHPQVDGVSFYGDLMGCPTSRPYTVQHAFNSFGDWTTASRIRFAFMRDDGWKFIRETSGGVTTEDLFNLTTSPPGWDGDPVMDPVVFLEMRTALDAWIGNL